MDNLSDIVGQVSFNAEVFFSGSLCGVQTLGNDNTGHLHMLQSGVLTILTDDGHKIRLDRPSVIFIPGKSAHRVISKESSEAKLVCASITFNPGHDTFIQSLPRFIYFDGSAHSDIQRATDWLFDEAFEDALGRRAMLDKLSDIIMLQILRHVTEQGLMVHGVLSALVHPQLSKVIKAIQKSPSAAWTLESLAEIASMSRSKFAQSFRDTMGQTPNDYLTEVRLLKAQELLLGNKPVNIVANEVGYEHGSALTRVFRKKFGKTPRAWLKSALDK